MYPERDIEGEWWHKWTVPRPPAIRYPMPSPFDVQCPVEHQVVTILRKHDIVIVGPAREETVLGLCCQIYKDRRIDGDVNDAAIGNIMNNLRRVVPSDRPPPVNLVKSILEKVSCKNPKNIYYVRDSLTYIDTVSKEFTVTGKVDNQFVIVRAGGIWGIKRIPQDLANHLVNANASHASARKATLTEELIENGYAHVPSQRL